ncbi:hypothetical protein OXYTRIMIC_338 [Oxytricha trifallax]|uniref:Uncharacterized protein n=1 Tax=Oxytricha trifallax TaxID=1172189 RepID=A0A073HZT4_9SPIT|nr:hypothetical protein OXYTRIMIC_338 [Oxytricha trifallax]
MNEPSHQRGPPTSSSAQALKKLITPLVNLLRVTPQRENMKDSILSLSTFLKKAHQLKLSFRQANLLSRSFYLLLSFSTFRDYIRDLATQSLLNQLLNLSSNRKITFSSTEKPMLILVVQTIRKAISNLESEKTTLPSYLSNRKGQSQSSPTPNLPIQQQTLIRFSDLTQLSNRIQQLEQQLQKSDLNLNQQIQLINSQQLINNQPNKISFESQLEESSKYFNLELKMKHQIQALQEQINNPVSIFQPQTSLPPLDSQQQPHADQTQFQTQLNPLAAPFQPNQNNPNQQHNSASKPQPTHSTDSVALFRQHISKDAEIFNLKNSLRTLSFPFLKYKHTAELIRQQLLELISGDMNDEQFVQTLKLLLQFTSTLPKYESITDPLKNLKLKLDIKEFRKLLNNYLNIINQQTNQLKIPNKPKTQPPLKKTKREHSPDPWTSCSDSDKDLASDHLLGTQLSYPQHPVPRKGTGESVHLAPPKEDVTMLGSHSKRDTVSSQ